jgi:sterol desaturase/sphingolipid hydroxylase (fatty acid hydroxylase superfamily)
MGRRYFPWMLALAGLFVLRVLAQLIQAIHPVSFLPPFHVWHGAVLPYPLLVASQVAVILVLASLLWRVRTDAISPSPWKYWVCFMLGGAYFSFMGFRLFAGLTFLADHPWFSKSLPAFFHVVLATFVLMLGHYLYKEHAKRMSRFSGLATVGRSSAADGSAKNFFSRLAVVGSYPAIMMLGFALYSAFSGAGLSAALASYASVLIGAALISLHEIKLPYREEWKPGTREIGNDAAFMVTVQIALPYFFSVTLVIALSEQLRTNGVTVQGLWPHDLPIAAQACLMLLAADFPRYWLHRAFHKFTPMWRFHAVHHSPHRLYWLNVGRFHPIEKAVQYAVDALPFALLGVSTDVLAAYFIFYAANGFFQHSNCRVRLGPLNYIVSGPELHRWHHSELAKESDHNFGNNLIVWDLLFGTRFLPEDREVGPLGLVNRQYPTGFLVQMKTPFIPGLENG